MWKRVLNYGVLTGAIATLALTACTPDRPSNTSTTPDPTPTPAPTPTAPAVDRQAGLRSQSIWVAVTNYVTEQGSSVEDLTFKSDYFDLNGDGSLDALVLLGPPSWCGSGGCTLLVFEGQGEATLNDDLPDNEFRLVSQTTLVQSPLTVSDNLTEGWHDLLVPVSGGGATPKQVALQFDGSTYPDNPSVLEPLPEGASTAGTEVLQDERFRTAGDEARLEQVCLAAVAQKYGASDDDIALEFGRTDEGGTAYSYTILNGPRGTCRVMYDGKLEYLQEAPQE